MHRAHEQGAGDGPAQGSGVEVGATTAADVEGAATHRDQALLDQGRAAVDGAGELGAVGEGAPGHLVDLGLVVLPEVGGVGAGDRPLLAHPGDGDGGVETSGEGDADALADGEGSEDLGHEWKTIRRSA